MSFKKNNQYHNVAVVVAAGKSSRMGGGINKVLSPLQNRPVLSYCLETFQRSKYITQVAVVGRDEDQEQMQAIIKQFCPKAQDHFVSGGTERFDSVKNGLEHFANLLPRSVLIHDAARPFLTEAFIEDSIQALDECPGAIVGVPLKDTLKEVNTSNIISQTHDRHKYWLAQTPQTFRYSDILQAYRQCKVPPYPTDDGAVLEMWQQPVKMVMGSYLNMKLTTPEDRLLAEAIISIQQQEPQ